MSSATTAIYDRFLSFRRVPLKIVFITLLASWALMVGAIFLNQPIYVIAFFTLLPWIPLALFEGVWKYKHYGWLSIFAVVAVLQVGHYGEHFVQVTELGFFNGTLACPPPADTEENRGRADTLAANQGLPEGVPPATGSVTNNSATRIVVPDENGVAATPAVIGPPACGVFGQFDFEPIHLVWDSLVWIGGLVLLSRFPRNKWLWIAVIFASLHEIEHLFLGWIYLFESGEGQFMAMAQQWATTADGSLVTATPVGRESIMTDFYRAGALSGIMGKNGMVESIFFGQGDLFLLRPYLHFIYNTLVVVPTVIAFLVQSRRAYDEYLDTIPGLSEDQKIGASTKLERQTFGAGDVIIRQDDAADKFYIITRGQVEVLREQDGQETLVTRLGSGQYFGEIGLMHGGKRTATVRAVDDVEVMALDRDTFGGLMEESDLSKKEVDRLTEQRVKQLQSLQSGDGSG